VQHMTDISALPSDSLVKARTSANMQAAFVRQALKYLQERLLFVSVAYMLQLFFLKVICRLLWGDGGGRHWLVRVDCRRAGWSVCLPLLIFSCTIKSRSSFLAPAHPGGPGKRAV